MKFSRNGKIIVLLIVLFGVGVFIGIQRAETKKIQQINSFEACAQLYPVMESYPEQCRTPDGRNFVKQIPNQQITITGESVCLPHKNKDGPQTMECAYGIKETGGNYYGLRDPEMKFMSDLATGKTITVSGIITDEPESNYDIVGVIEIQSLSTQ